MSKDESSNLLLYIFSYLCSDKKFSQARTFIYNMGEPIKILDLAKKIIFLSGRPTKKFLDNKYTGLKKTEKVTEHLIGKNERMIHKYENNIYEIKRKINKKKIINLIDIQRIIKRNNDFISNKYLKKIMSLINM